MEHEHADVDRTPILEAACRVYHVTLLELIGLDDDGELHPGASGVELIVDYEPDFHLPWLDEFTEFKRVLEAIYGPCIELSMSGSPRANELCTRPPDRRIALYEA